MIIINGSRRWRREGWKVRLAKRNNWSMRCGLSRREELCAHAARAVRPVDGVHAAHEGIATFMTWIRTRLPKNMRKMSSASTELKSV